MSVSTAIPPAPHPKHLAAISNHDPPTVNAQGQVSAPGQVDHSGGPGGCVVSIGARVEKLPLGQSLVTLVRENDANFQPVIQIKVGFFFLVCLSLTWMLGSNLAKAPSFLPTPQMRVTIAIRLGTPSPTTTAPT